MMRLVLIATLGSVAILAGAYAFQHIGGMAPCKLCLWQRWPHISAISIGVVLMLTGEWRMAWLGVVAMLSTAMIGIYHVGVEQDWWEGPTSCSAGDISNLDPQALLDQILTAPLVRCDDIAWQLAGISMAGWNAILSLILAAIWLQAFRKA
ncbi:MAG: disulfide bond formation protein B [Sulfitobacter sp.]